MVIFDHFWPFFSPLLDMLQKKYSSKNSLAANFQNNGFLCFLAIFGVFGRKKNQLNFHHGGERGGGSGQRWTFSIISYLKASLTAFSKISESHLNYAKKNQLLGSCLLCPCSWMANWPIPHVVILMFEAPSSHSSRCSSSLGVPSISCCYPALQSNIIVSYNLLKPDMYYWIYFYEPLPRPFSCRPCLIGRFSTTIMLSCIRVILLY